MEIFGYRGICSEDGIFVDKKDAYKYALERIEADPDLAEEFETWFYSGNFIPIEREDQTC